MWCMACAGDIPTKEVLVGRGILHREIPTLRIRCAERGLSCSPLQPSEHIPTGFRDRDFSTACSHDKPADLSTFHGLSVADHRLATGPQPKPTANMHCRRGLQGKGQHQPPHLELANEQPRSTASNLVIDVIDRGCHRLGSRGCPCQGAHGNGGDPSGHPCAMPTSCIDSAESPVRAGGCGKLATEAPG